MAESTYEERRELERAEDKRVRDRLYAIAFVLGYTPKEGDEAPYGRHVIVRNGSQTLTLREDTHLKAMRNKVIVFGWSPRSENHLSTVMPKEITLSLSKSNEELAAAIQRRYLADYDLAFAAALKEKKELDDAKAARESLAQELAAIIKETQHNFCASRYDKDEIVDAIEVQVHYDNSVKIELTTDKDAAKKILHFLVSL